MIGPDIIFRHVLAIVVPCGFAFMVFLASRATDFFWARITGVVLALLTFYFSMMIMNRLLFTHHNVEVSEAKPGDVDPPPPGGAEGKP